MSLDRDAPTASGGHALSAVSWAAVFAGAAVAVAAAFALDLLGAGFGLALSSPWLATRASLAGFSPKAGAWALAAEAVALALGGYVAGRLRTHWWGVHADEAHFRDTAHGLLVWAVSSIVGVALTALVLAPYAATLGDTPVAAVRTASGALAIVTPSAAALAAEAERAHNIATQAAFFGAVGLFLGAFVAAVGAALGGRQRDAAALPRPLA